MRARYICALLLAIVPGSARAADVRVGIYAAHPPARMTITATDGTLAWRTCASCEEKRDRSLTIDAAGNQLKIGKAAVGRELYVRGHYRLAPLNAPEFTAGFPLHVESGADGAVLIVSMPLENYVQAVLAAEVGGAGPAESLRAMAVAARTYAMHFHGAHEKQGFDFCDTTHCQTMRWSGVSPRIVAASDATRGEVLSFQGVPAATYYHQNCGGMVAAAQEVWANIHEPYLPGHADRYCSVAGGLNWESTIAVADLDRALHEATITTPVGWELLDVLSRGPSGRARELELGGGTSPNVRVSASSFRFAVGRALGWNKIRSEMFEVRNRGDRITFSGRGSGHGVGLCQQGAEEMAREGKTYQEILSFYYPGTHLGPAASTTPVVPAAAKEYRAPTPAASPPMAEAPAAAPAKHDQPVWQQRSDERFDLISTEPDRDASLLPVAERILRENEAATQWKLASRVRLQVFATMDSYRDTTGQPGWVAATTRGHTIRLQPAVELQRRSVLESTLRHELFHLLVEERTRNGTPLWFREGVVLYLAGLHDGDAGDPAGERGASAPDAADALMTGERIDAILASPGSNAEAQKAYGAARRRVAGLVEKYGRETVLGWLSAGIPRGVAIGPGSAASSGTPQQ
jgi:stage II sporulation protein D